MKIQKIKFKNINALRGEHEIDFSGFPLNESQLFAITGPTGSGKSTLLDVIALALFNQVPRLGRVSNKLITSQGALMTRNTDEAMATVVYISKGNTYRSVWEISTNRNGNLRDYDMRLEDLTTGKTLDYKKSEVRGANEELIGLSYDQFIKSILLAQGEFAQFLNAKRADRGALLEQITGTGIYRKLGMKAFERKSQYGKVLEELQTKRELVSVKLLAETVFADQKQAFEKMGEELEKMVEKEGGMKQQIQLRLELKEIAAKVEKQRQEAADKNQIYDDFKTQYGDLVQAHEATLPFAEALGKYQTNVSKIAEWEQTIERLKGDLSMNEGQQSALLLEIGALLKKEVAAGQVLEALTEFQEKVAAIEKKRVDYRSQYGQVFSKLEVKELKVNFFRRDTPTAVRKLIEALQKELSQAVATLKGRLQGLDLENLEGESDRLVSKLGDLNRRGDWLEQLEGINKNSNQEQKEKTALSDRLVQIPAEVRGLQKELAEVEAKYQLERMAQNDVDIRERLTDLRADLKAGQPCPLCGSEEHPWRDTMPESREDRLNELKVLEGLQKDLSERISALNGELRAKEEQLVGVKNRLEEQENKKGELAGKIRELEGKWGWAVDLAGSQLALQLEEQKNVLKEYVSLSGKIGVLEECWPLLDELAQLYEAGILLKQEKEGLYSGDDIGQVCEKYRSEWRLVGDRLAGLNKQLKQQGGQLAELKLSHRDLVGQLNDQIRAKGWESIAQVIEQRMGEQEYKRLKDLESQNRSAMMAAESSLVALKLQKEELALKCTNESEEEIEELWREIKDLIAVKREERNEVKRLIENHEENEREVKQLDNQIKNEGALSKKWVLLNELIGDSIGKRFNDYAQELTLQRLLVLANHRLAGLTDRYQLATPVEGEDGEGLMVVDDHLGGQRRSVKTLSGGETFLMSLSLALALSDLAAKNVEINSLFIDEGFGTLDPETLDQTIDTLERLQMESAKTIGIISHVESLKERIGTQIQLKRNGQGYSSLKVVG